MKKYILLLYLLLFISAAANSQIIASESFDYAPGTNVIGASGGAGWADAWSKVTTGVDKFVVADSIANYRTGQKSGRALNLNLADGNIRMERTLANPVSDDGGTYWMAFMADFFGGEGGNVMNVILANIGLTAASGGAGQEIRVGKEAGGAQIGFDDRTTTRIVDGRIADRAYWFVVKVEFSGDANVDVVHLFLDPDPGVEPTNDMAVGTINTDKLNNGFDGIMIKIEGSPSNFNSNVDDLIVGNTYADVIPTAVRDIQKYLPVRENFNYIVGGLGGNGGTENGWGGPWQLLSGFDHALVSEGVANDAVEFTTSPNALNMDLSDGSFRIKRPLAATYEDNGLTYWMSFMADFSDVGNGNVMNVMLVDNSSQVLGGGGPNGQLLRIGKLFNNQNIGIDDRSGASVEVPDEAVKPQWFVLQIETTGNADNDTVRLWLNPELGVEPVPGTELLKYTANLLNDGWQAIGIKIEGSGNIQSTLDDIYLALDYADVIPDNQPVVDGDPFVAYEHFNYPAGEPLAGQGDTPLDTAWSSPWIKIRGDDVVVNEESIISEFTEANGGSVSLSITEGEQDTTVYERAFKTTFSDNGAEVWISFLMNSTDFQVSKNALLELYLGADPVVAFGGLAGLSTVGVVTPETTVGSDEEINGINWIVARIGMSGNAEPEKISLWVNPDPTLPPVDATASVLVEPTDMNAISLNGGFDRIRLSAQGFTPFEVGFDEIQVGFTFNDVTELEQEPDPNLIAQDLFTYSEGPLTGQGVADDQWAGPWQFVGTEEGGTITPDPLEISAVGVRGISNKVTLSHTTGQARYVRELAEPILDDGNAYWVGALMNFGAGSEEGGNVGQLYLWNSGFAPPQDQRLAMGRIFGDVEGRIALDDRASELRPATDVLGSLNTLWLVMKVQMSGDEAADSAYLWVNPSPELEDLDINTAGTKIGSASLNDGFDGIFIKAEGGTELTVSFDDIKLGTTYRSVLPLVVGGGTVTSLEVQNTSRELMSYPNPFDAFTYIAFSLEQPTEVQLTILDTRGRLVTQLVNKRLQPGEHQVRWDGTDFQGNRLPSGIYFYRLQQANSSMTRRLIIHR